MFAEGFGTRSLTFSVFPVEYSHATYPSPEHKYNLLPSLLKIAVPLLSGTLKLPKTRCVSVSRTVTTSSPLTAARFTKASLEPFWDAARASESLFTSIGTPIVMSCFAVCRVRVEPAHPTTATKTIDKIAILHMTPVSTDYPLASFRV